MTGFFGAQSLMTFMRKPFPRKPTNPEPITQPPQPLTPLVASRLPRSQQGQLPDHRKQPEGPEPAKITHTGQSYVHSPGLSIPSLGNHRKAPAHVFLLPLSASSPPRGFHRWPCVQSVTLPARGLWDYPQILPSCLSSLCLCVLRCRSRTALGSPENPAHPDAARPENLKALTPRGRGVEVREGDVTQSG